MGLMYQATKGLSMSLLRGLWPTDLGELLDKAKRLSDEGCLVERVDVVPEVAESYYPQSMFWPVPESDYEDNVFGPVPVTIKYFLNFRALIKGRSDIAVRELADVRILSYDFVNIAEAEARLMRKANDAALRIGKAGFNSRVEEDWKRPYQQEFLNHLAGTALGQEGLRLAMARYDSLMRRHS